MISFKIPEAYKSGFKAFIALDKDSRETLIQEIVFDTENTPLKSVSNGLADKLHLDAETTTSIIEALISLLHAKETSNVSVDKFVDRIIDALNNVFEDDEVKPDELLKEQLKKLFSFKSKLYIRTKASYLTSERERLFLNARILTDIRPIFPDEDTDKVEGGIIIHNLKISYRHGEDEKEAFFAMDLEDLEKLKEQIVRAETKEKKLRNILLDANINFIDLNQQ